VRKRYLLADGNSQDDRHAGPANGIAGQGLIQPGMWADIVVFNPDTLRDKATYTEPRGYAEAWNM